MIVIKIVEQKPFEVVGDCYALLCEQDFAGSDQLNMLAQSWCPTIKEIMHKHDFTGKAGQLFSLPVVVDKKVVHCVLVGLGKKQAGKAIEVETYRRALGKIVKNAQANKCESIVLSMPCADLFGVSVEFLAQQTAIILNMANYHFTDFITDSACRGGEIFEVTLLINAHEAQAVQAGVKAGESIAYAVNSARHWVDFPPSDLTPPHLADKALDIAKKHNLTFTVFNEEEIIKMGMGGLSGVSRGSDLECRLAIMEYRTQKPNAPTLAFVGKGITFDSGGLSLKSANHMENMKEDMSGAAAVIAAMGALAELKPDVNVIGVTALSENLPSGKALKPGDILRFYNGKTAEVKNTDAEGRLILADALSYAVKHYNPDIIIDLATLTGACAYALGPFYSGLMSQHDDLVAIVLQAARRSGDHCWRLPLDDDYKPAIKSDVADLSNIGSPKYMAGAITAGHFLKNFVGDTPWVHLDIAGTAFNVPDISYYRPGATGVGVRLIVDLAMNWKK